MEPYGAALSEFGVSWFGGVRQRFWTRNRNVLLSVPLQRMTSAGAGFNTFASRPPGEVAQKVDNWRHT